MPCPQLKQHATSIGPAHGQLRQLPSNNIRIKYIIKNKVLSEKICIEYQDVSSIKLYIYMMLVLRIGRCYYDLHHSHSAFPGCPTLQDNRCDNSL